MERYFTVPIEFSKCICFPKAAISKYRDGGLNHRHVLSLGHSLACIQCFSWYQHPKFLILSSANFNMLNIHLDFNFNNCIFYFWFIYVYLYTYTCVYIAKTEGLGGFYLPSSVFQSLYNKHVLPLWKKKVKVTLSPFPLDFLCIPHSEPTYPCYHLSSPITPKHR